MPTHAETLASYVPVRVARRAAEDPASFSEPAAEVLHAAVLFADISGFTALTERLAVRGAAGAEDLTRLLNAYLGRLVDMVTASGGDVLKFAGDAVLALWTADDEAGLPDAVVRVCECALAVQEQLDDYAVADDVRFSLKLSVGAGRVVTATLGGVFDRWEFLVAGSPLRQVGSANAVAAPGDTVVAPEAWALVASRCDGEAAPLGNVKLERVREPAPPAPLEPVSVTEEASAALRAFIPAAIRSRLDAGQSDWLAELRRLTVLFVNLPDLTEDTPLAEAQEAMRALQGALYRFEGSINKLSVDDKGTSLLAALGLPPLAHEDDPSRGVRAALAMREALAALGERSSIGVTTGLAFCGSVGGERRREYTIMGDVVNLAARLMQAAMGGVLCDRATESAAGDRLEFEPLAEMKMKGKKEPVAVFRPVGVVAGPPRAERVAAKGEIVGREAERGLFARLMRGLARERASGRVAIAGEAGLGKSRLVEELLARSRDGGALALSGAGDAVESGTPYYAWRRVFADLFALDGVEPAERAARAAARLPEDARDLAPLLSAVLPVEIPDTPATAALEGKLRAEATHALLARLLADAAASRPLVVAIEDAHWLDTGSLALLEVVSERVRPSILAVASRPMGDRIFPELARFEAAAGTDVVRLTSLSPEATVELVRRRLGVSSLPEVVADVVREKAGGNPFFAEELAYAMRDSGLIVVEDGECRIAPGAKATNSWALPDTVQGVVTSRIDRLGPGEQLAIKVASVIGRVVGLRTLSEVFPVEAGRDALADHVEVLRSLDLTPLERTAPDVEYVFKHVITQEVAYNLLPYEQRRRLHRAVAEWVESRHAADLEPHYPYLAHHWRLAAEDRTPDPECVERAVEYLRRAGDLAVRAYVNQEAIGFYSDALRLLEFLPESAERDGRELRMRLALGAVLIATRGYASEEVARTYERARALCEGEGDEELLFAALRGLWAYHIGRAEYATARELARRMLSIAEARDDAASRMEAHRALGNTAFWFGELDEAREQMGRGIDLYAPDRDRGLALRFGQDPDVANRGMQTWPLAISGRATEALARGAEALARAREVGHPYSIGYALVHDAGCRQYLGLVDDVRSRAEEVVALATSKSFPNWLIAGTVLGGWAAAKSGDSEGADRIRAMTDAWRSYGSELCVPYFLSLLGEACLEAGRVEEGIAAVDEAIAVADRNDDRWYEAETLRLAGELRRRRGDAPEATAEWFRRALARATDQGARLFELRAAVALARLDGSEAARERVASAAAAIDGAPDLPDLVAARAAGKSGAA